MRDYEPFGVLLPGRYAPGEQSKSYRFGFQGQESDKEINGERNSYAFEYRMHDPGVGRFLSIDPLAPQCPHNSPYACSENLVIDGVELEGKEFDSVGKEAAKYILQIVPSINYKTGSDGSSVGVSFSIGLSKYLPISYRKDLNVTYNFSDWITDKPQLETIATQEVSYVSGFVNIASKQIRSGSTSQTIDGIQIGGPGLNVRTTNDWIPASVAKALDPMGILPENSGDRGDRFRNASGEVNLGPLSVGFRLHTVAPGLSPAQSLLNTDPSKGPNGTYTGPANDFRDGVGFVGLGPLKMGYNSESNRDGIQNTLHESIGSHRFEKQNNNSFPFYDISNGADQ